MSATTMSPGIEAYQKVWEDTLGQLELQMTKATFDALLRKSPLVQVKDDVLVIGVVNNYTADWLENRLKQTVERTLAAIAGRPLTVEFVVLSDHLHLVPPTIRSLDPSIPDPPYPPEERNDNGNGRFALHGDGYGGNMTPSEREALLARIAAREAPRRGRPLQLPMPMANQADGAVIELVEDDPLFAHIRTSHYAMRFWRPYLGLLPFGLWELLRSYHYFVKHHNGEWPSVQLLMDSLGIAQRGALLGRSACKGREAQEGAIQVLEREGILRHHTRGDNRHQIHYFTHVRQQLPILTPFQVGRLTPLKQEEHRRFLSYYGFDEEKWLGISSRSQLLDVGGELNA